MAIMGSDDTIVGKPSGRKPTQVTAAHPMAPAGSPDRQRRDQQDGSRPNPQFCGAMSQQRDDRGAQSMPQKFVHLVGCRDPKARSSFKP
jgi:hypothetical protein